MMNLCIPTGNSKKGVVLYRNADVLLRSSQLEDCAYSFIIVCKVSVHVTTNAVIVTDILLLCIFLHHCMQGQCMSQLMLL